MDRQGFFGKLIPFCTCILINIGLILTFFFKFVIKCKNQKYHTVGTFPISNRKIVERGKIDIPNIQILIAHFSYNSVIHAKIIIADTIIQDAVLCCIRSG